MNQIRFLITAIGTAGATTVINELKKNIKNAWIIGTDINEKNRIVTSKDVDEFYKFPSAISDEIFYYDYVRNFCTEHKIDYLFCFIDEEVVNLSRHRDELRKQGTILCTADNNTIEICHYKDRFAQWIEKNIPSIAIKRFLSIEDVRDSDYPLFVKPIEGRASIGCYKVSNAKELHALGSLDGLVLQQFIEGEIYSVDITRNKKYNQLCVIQRKELLRNSNGCGIAVEITDDPTLNDISKELAKKLDLNGSINAEFFRTESGYRIIEVNPRLPAGVAYSCMAGCNTVICTLNIAQGEKCEFGCIKVGKHYARRYETYEL